MQYSPLVSSPADSSSRSVEAAIAGEDSPEEPRKLRVLSIVGFALTIVVLIFGAITGYMNASRVAYQSKRVAHTHEVICALEALLSTVKDAETGQRGFLLTQLPQYLETHDQAVPQVEAGLEEIKTLTSDNAAQQAHLAELDVRIKAKLNELQTTIQLAKDGNREESLRLVSLGAGKAFMDEARGIVSKMKQEEHQLLDLRTKEADASYRTTLFVIFFSALTGISLIALVIILNEASIRQKQHAATILAQQKEWYRVTLASIGDGVLTTDAQGRVTFLNGVAEALTGWSSRDAKGKHFDEVFHILNEYTRAPVDNPINKVLAHGVTVGLANHTILISKEGFERPIDDSAAPIVNQDKQLEGVVLVFRDFKERRDQERELEIARARLASTLSAAEIGTWEYDPHANRLRSDENVAQMVGFSPKGHPSLEDFLEIVHPEDRDRLRQAVNRSVETAESAETEYRITLPSGQSKAVISRWRVDRGDEDRSDRLLGVLIDVTRQRETELALAESLAESDRLRQLYDSILSHSADFNYTFDLQGRFTFVNKALLDLWQLQLPDAVGKNFFDLNYPPELAARLQRQIQQVIDTRQPVRDETLYTSHLGERAYDYIFVPIFGANGEVELVAGSTRDITAQKQVQAELREVAARLSEADRRKDEFLATLAHELRNPLAPISAGLEAMKNANDDPAALKMIRSSMERQTRQMVRLIDDLLDVSRITQGKMELRLYDVDLQEILRNAVEATQPFVQEAHHQLTQTIPPEPIVLHADPNRLAQVFANLINNATKYTPESGKIELAVERREKEAVVTIRDNGIGIPPELQGRIFEMFAQIDRHLEKGYKGLGIGLTLVKRLVEMHQGRIEVHSAGAGQGTEFQVFLPIASHSSLPAPTTVMEQPANQAPLRILVVDDNVDAANMLGLVVKVLGNTVRLAHDGREAISAAEEFNPDLVLMDIGMPHMNGYEAVRHLREQPWGKDLFVVALTGWGQEEDRRKSKEAGFNQHLVKPVDPTDLQRLLGSITPKTT